MVERPGSAAFLIASVGLGPQIRDGGIHMKHIFTAIALGALLVAGAVRAQDGDKRDLSQDNITISIEKTADSLKGFKAFKVQAKNDTDGPKSVEIRIYLNDN